MSQSLTEIEAQIAALEQKIADEPFRLKAEKERKRQAELDKKATLPPSDEVIDKIREHKHNAQMTNGERSNARVEQGRDFVLLILFLLGIVVLAGWFIKALAGG